MCSWPSDAEHARRGKRRGFNVPSLENAKIEINQWFSAAQGDFLLVIRSLACWFVKIYSVTNEQHTLPKYPQLPSGLSRNMIYGLWPRQGLRLLPKYSFTLTYGAVGDAGGSNNSFTFSEVVGGQLISQLYTSFTFDPSGYESLMFC